MTIKGFLHKLACMNLFLSEKCIEIIDIINIIRCNKMLLLKQRDRKEFCTFFDFGV